jgi:hypothetical protein
MSVYVDSLIMAEAVSRNMYECKNKFVVQWLVVKTYICDATARNMYNIKYTRNCVSAQKFYISSALLYRACVNL